MMKSYIKNSLQPCEWSFYKRFIKRPMDFLLSFFAIIVLSPILLAVAVLVAVKLGRPVLFKQSRPGFNEKVFTLYKFRSMTEERDINGNLLPDEKRLTRFGKFLRAASLDELPELFNILKGDMSIVGPRPLLADYLPFYTENEHHRHDVRPGLTGLSQISGRNYVTWEEKFSLDLEYIENCNFITDCKIIFSTIYVVFRRSNVETASSYEHNGVLYRPLDVERREKLRLNSD